MLAPWRAALVWLATILFPCVERSVDAAVAADPDATPSAAELEFFEKEVRPLLAANCGECHGAQEQWAGLRLDSRESMLRGGESGAAIAPGDPEKSLLIAAVRQSGELQMPPDGKLEDQQIAILEKWVALGAPWPASDVLADDERAVAQRRHWAFRSRRSAAAFGNLRTGSAPPCSRARPGACNSLRPANNSSSAAARRFPRSVWPERK